MYLLVIAIVIALTQATIPSEMMEMMDTSVDPCDNFYKYACGGWLKSHSLQSTDISIDSSFHVIGKHNEKVILDIMKEKHPVISEFWQSCIDIDKITALGNIPLQKDLHRLMNAENMKEVMELAGEYSRMGSTIMAKFHVKSDSIDSTRHTLYLLSPDLTLPSTEYYTNDRFPMIEKEYREYINGLMKLSGLILPNELSAFDIVHRVEKQLVINQNANKGRVHRMSLKHIIARWPTTVGMFLKGLGLWKEVNIPNHFVIYIESLHFITLGNVIHSLSFNELKVYIAYLLVHSRAHWLGMDFMQLLFQFYGQTINGRQQLQSRENVCVTSLLKVLPDLIGSYYYEKAFDPERHKYAYDMLKYIQDAMGKSISHSTWLNTNAENAARTKLNKVLALIGKSTHPRSHPSSLSHDNYPKNMYTILSHTFDMSLKKLTQRVNREEWVTSPASVNAFYTLRSNSLSIPAGILQPPFFNGSNVHPARNFGGIGSIMGHELTHGFDPVGRLFDGDGNQRPWWSELTAKVYEIRTKCYRRQYSAFELYGEHGWIGKLNGALTIKENIADNGGVAIAWDAYRNYMTTVKSDTHGLSQVEGDVVFFLAFGQSYCGKTRDERMKLQLAKDSHSPPEFRVNGVVMNNDDFAKVFNCKVNSPMNPEKKCRLW